MIAFQTVHMAVGTDWSFNWTNSMNWVKNPAETLHAEFCIYQNILQWELPDTKSGTLSLIITP